MPSEVPSIDLGPAFEPIGFVPGRYAVVIERNMVGAHGRNHVRHQSRTSLVLELADGRATACRGWRHDLHVDGPGVQQDQRFRVQQGFRGIYAVRDGEVDVELAADDSPCAEVREGQAPPRSATMTLRCVLAKARSHASIGAPVLLCEWREADSFARYAFAADGLAPGRWLVLGSGNGLLVHMTGRPESTTGAPVKVKVEPSPTPIEPSAWDEPPPLPETWLEP